MSVKVLDDVMVKLLASGKPSENYKNKRFYGHFIANMKKIFVDKLPGGAPAGVKVTDKIELYISNTDFPNFSELQQVEILEHECKHVMNFHMRRYEGCSSDPKDAKMWNVACDIEINGPLKSLHEYGCTSEKFNKIIPDIKHGEIAEYYFNVLKKYQKENPDDKKFSKFMKTVDDHSKWEESKEFGENDELTKEIIKRELKKAAESTGVGNTPNEVLVAIDRLNKSAINWKQQLRRFFARTDKFHKESTRRKPNRRYRYLQCGRKKVPDAHIAIALDNSGSVGNDEFTQFFAELDKIVDHMRVTIIEADCQVNAVYEYKKNMKIERHGYGGTAYMPAINKAIDLKVDGMIYFGDGDIFGETLKKPRFPFLWALVRKSPPPAEWGGVIRVEVGTDGKV